MESRRNTIEQCQTERDAEKQESSARGVPASTSSLKLSTEKQESSARGEPASTSSVKLSPKSEGDKPQKSKDITENMKNNPSVLHQTKRCLGQKIRKLFE